MLVLENIGIIPSFCKIVPIDYNVISANVVFNKLGNISDVGSRDQNQLLEQGNHQLWVHICLNTFTRLCMHMEKLLWVEKLQHKNLASKAHIYLWMLLQALMFAPWGCLGKPFKNRRLLLLHHLQMTSKLGFHQKAWAGFLLDGGDLAKRIQSERKMWLQVKRRGHYWGRLKLLVLKQAILQPPLVYLWDPGRRLHRGVKICYRMQSHEVTAFTGLEQKMQP